MTIPILPIPPRVRDYTGVTFGQLHVLGFAGFHQSTHQRFSIWLCQCLCGRQKVILLNSLRDGRSVTCGCRLHEYGASHLKQTYSHEYQAWVTMWQRCTNPKATAFAYYGGQGILVTPEWRSFDRFIQDVGPRPGPRYSLDRYPDQRGNYCQGNTRWATQSEQTRNMKRNRMLTYEGITLCLTDWAIRLGISEQSMSKRLKRDLPQAAIFLPGRQTRRPLKSLR